MTLTARALERRRWRRRGTWEVIDPRPQAADAPYTFFLPQAEELALLRPGDFVQLLFTGDPPSRRYGAERMWIEVDRIEGERMRGHLRSKAWDMPQLRPGTMVECGAHEIVATRYADDERERAYTDGRRSWWARCLVDRSVLDDKVPVEFVYRETPDMADEGDIHPDSGWRIRGRAGDDDIDERKLAYVALGAVLNKDDSWLSLIDEPVGSAFMRDFAAGTWVRDVSDGER